MGSPKFLPHAAGGNCITGAPPARRREGATSVRGPAPWTLFPTLWRPALWTRPVEAPLTPAWLERLRKLRPMLRQWRLTPALLCAGARNAGIHKAAGAEVCRTATPLHGPTRCSKPCATASRLPSVGARGHGP